MHPVEAKGGAEVQTPPPTVRPPAALGLSREATSILLVILAGTAMRLVVALVLPLSVDESYAVVLGRRLSLSYFDHPPMTFWWVGLATRLAHSESPLVVRAPFIAAFMATTWVLGKLGCFLFGERVGLWSAILVNVSLFLSLSAGGWALPDGPLLLFSAASAYCLARATVADGRSSEDASVVAGPGRLREWVGFGVCAGLALLSKYHGVFLLAGACVYLLTSRRRAAWLTRAEPYVAAACAAVLFMPVVLWNARNQWASFRFQGARALPAPESGATPFSDSVLGQAAWTLPWIWVPLLLATFLALAAGTRDSRRWLLLCLGGGPVFGFTLLALLGSRGHPHWAAPGYFLLMPLLGVAAIQVSARAAPRVERWLWVSCVAFGLVVLGLVSHARTGWLRSVAPRLSSWADPTDDLLDWSPVARQLKVMGLPGPNAIVGAARWDDAAKMAVAMGPEAEVRCVGEDARGFASLTAPTSSIGRDVVLVVRRRPGPEPLVAYAAYFDNLRALAGVSIERGGREEITIGIYQGRGLRGPLPRLQRR